MRKVLYATILLLGSGTAALAADNGLYLGAAVGRSNLEIDDLAGIDAADFKGDDTGYKLIVGIRPLDWLAISAFKTQPQIFTLPPSFLPIPPILDNFRQVWRETPIARAFLNSVIISAGFVSLSLFLCSLAGYASCVAYTVSIGVLIVSLILNRYRQKEG